MITWQEIYVAQRVKATKLLRGTSITISGIISVNSILEIICIEVGGVSFCRPITEREIPGSADCGRSMLKIKGCTQSLPFVTQSAFVSR